MKNTILIITSSYDKTCDYLISKYTEITFFRFNIDLFSSYSISITSTGFIIKNQFHEVDNFSCKSIYYRKPVAENLTSIFEDRYLQFAQKEIFSVIEGIAEAFQGKCLTKPSLMRKAGNKTFQALCATKVGFQIPALVITNDFREIEVNALNQERMIVKPLAIGSIVNHDEKEFVQTNLYKKENDLSLLKYTPAYFQNYIKKDYEVRATFINGKSFAVRIDSVDPVDWRRIGNEVKYQVDSLPQHIFESCLAFLKEVNMSFGCFDFIIQNDSWYFLEMNSNGQWAWLEFETGLQISNEIIRFLNE